MNPGAAGSGEVGSPARYERIREHRLIATTLSVEGGQLTPTMKIKRRVIDREFAGLIVELYAQ